jgi:hypothetical protein
VEKYVKPEVKWLLAPTTAPIRYWGLDRGGLPHEEAQLRRLTWGATSMITDEPFYPNILSLVPGERVPEGQGQRSTLPLVTHGVEIRPGSEEAARDKTNASGVRRAVAQLQYAYLPLISERLKASIADWRPFQRYPPRFGYMTATIYTLFVVTTAELWLLSQSVTPEQVQQANQLTDIATPTDAVEFVGVQSPDLSQYQKVLYDTYTYELEQLHRNASESQRKAQSSRAEQVGYRLDGYVPSVVVANYSNLARLVKEHREFLTRFVSERVEPKINEHGLVEFRAEP